MINYFATSDYNKDGLNDLILQVRDEDEQKILLYENIGDFKFKPTNNFSLIDDFQNFGIRNLFCFDYDSDGDEDIIVTSYYRNNNKSGYTVIYKNNLWGDFSEIDTSLKSLTTHWNEKIIFADINNDNLLDIYNATLWKTDHILIGTSDNYSDETALRMPMQVKRETFNVLLSDFDNDADLDIFTIGKNDFIRVYENNGWGYFKEISYKLFDHKFFNPQNTPNPVSFNVADFNNDGYIDIIVSMWLADSLFTTLLLNKEGKEFKEAQFAFDNKSRVLYKSSITDVDNDGDLDIYGLTKGHNVLWINSLDKNNSIKIRLKGVTSTTNALGSKVWVYKENKLNDNNALLGFKQLGTETIGKNTANSLMLHFGLGNNKACDIKVLFPSGKIIQYENVSAGSFLTIEEYPPLVAFIYRIPGNIYRFIKKRENQIYVLIIICSHIFIVVGLLYGFHKLKWNSKLTTVFASLNISLFWLSFYWASFSSVYSTKFLVPLSLAILVTLIPLLLFFWLNKSAKKDTSGYNQRLLTLILTFSHGEFALRNLNSILLLCENRSTNREMPSEFYDKLKIRFNTFLEMTSVSIREIIELERLIGNNSDELNTLEISLNQAVDQIKKNNDELSFDSIVENFTIIKTQLKELRKDIYARFSSDPTEVINNVLVNYEATLKMNRILVEKIKRYPNNIPVLIKSYELGEVLDNLFQNSIKYMKNAEQKKIVIELYKESPKIIIIFSNTGTLIPKEKWDLIFEKGYSESGSTGLGLSNAREILNKYGGRIFVDANSTKITSFRIELNEGMEK